MSFLRIIKKINVFNIKNIDLFCHCIKNHDQLLGSKKWQKGPSKMWQNNLNKSEDNQLDTKKNTQVPVHAPCH